MCQMFDSVYAESNLKVLTWTDVYSCLIVKNEQNRVKRVFCLTRLELKKVFNAVRKDNVGIFTSNSGCRI